jgi:hypothetical protein
MSETRPVFCSNCGYERWQHGVIGLGCPWQDSVFSGPDSPANLISAPAATPQPAGDQLEREPQIAKPTTLKGYSELADQWMSLVDRSPANIYEAGRAAIFERCAEELRAWMPVFAGQRESAPTEAARDTERLDWMQNSKPWAVQLFLGRAEKGIFISGSPNGNVREAIDAARAAEAKKPA